jgi:hypothetical protein
MLRTAERSSSAVKGFLNIRKFRSAELPKASRSTSACNQQDGQLGPQLADFADKGCPVHDGQRNP